MSKISTRLLKYLKSNGVELTPEQEEKIDNDSRKLYGKQRYVNEDESEEEQQQEQESNDADYLQTQMRKFIQNNNVKQMQRDLLTYYCQTLSLNDYVTPDYILRGYHEFIKSQPHYHEQYKQNVLTIRNKSQLGYMLKNVSCMAKKVKSINNEKALYYWRKE